MNHITFKDKEGFDINVLAFDGEANFAILDRTSTGSPTPYVVVRDWIRNQLLGLIRKGILLIMRIV